MTPHPQANILRAIADGEVFQTRYKDHWIDVSAEGALRFVVNESSVGLRIKPKTININGYEVSEPMRDAPTKGTVYWPGFGSESGDTHTESADVGYYPTMLPDLLRKGLLHPTKEAATIHANALLSFTQRE